MMIDNTLLESALDKLRRYALVRDRDAERIARTVTLTDDEAWALLEEIDRLQGGTDG